MLDTVKPTYVLHHSIALIGYIAGNTLENVINSPLLIDIGFVVLF